MRGRSSYSQSRLERRPEGLVHRESLQRLSALALDASVSQVQILRFTVSSVAGSHPALEGAFLDLAPGVLADHVAGLSVDDAGERVVLEGDLGLDASEVLTELALDPGHVFDGVVKAILIFVAGVGDDLDVLGAILVPLFVESLQLFLEGSAARSPVSGVEGHDDLVAIDGLVARNVVAVLVDESAS